MLPFYKSHSRINAQEDKMNEFKSHRCMGFEDVPPWSHTAEKEKVVHTKQPVSKTINAFLNTGFGGVCYLGITNNGIVEGFQLSSYQKNHVVVSLHDLLCRFDPPVEQNRVKVRFVPVLDDGDEKLSKNAAESYEYSREEVEDQTLLRSKHLLRTHDFCWCDKLGMKAANYGILEPCYVIEIRIAPWSGSSESTPCTLPPIYQNESGHCFMRRAASNVQVSFDEMKHVVRNRIKNFYEPTLKRLHDTLAGFLNQNDGEVTGKTDIEGDQKVEALKQRIQEACEKILNRGQT